MSLLRNYAPESVSTIQQNLTAWAQAAGRLRDEPTASALPLTTINERLIIAIYFFSLNVFIVTRSTGVSTSSTAALGFSIIFKAVSIPNTAS